jgi:hypothetical protein
MKGLCRAALIAWVALASIASHTGRAQSVAATAAAARHVLIISIDGLHQADVTDPALAAQIPTILSLAQSGIQYANAHTTRPSDSFPGTLAYLTGAGPATTGVYYDVGYSRSLDAPNASPGDLRGAMVKLTEILDKNYDVLDGGGDFGFQSLSTANMLLDPSRNFSPVYPHEYLRINTIFEVAHAAGFRTVMMDKHPVYEIASGPSGRGLDDLYCPEIGAKVALVDGKLLDATDAPQGTQLRRSNQSADLTRAYDDLKLAAMLRQIRGEDARGTSHPGPPGLIAMNFQAVNIAEKDKDHGGIEMVNGREAPSQLLKDNLHHVDDDLAQIVAAIKSAGLWDQTLIVLTAKHGNNPRVGKCSGGGLLLVDKTLADAGVSLGAQAADDAGVFWFLDPALVPRAAKAIQEIKDNGNPIDLDGIYFGDSLKSAGLAGPTDRTPDLVITLKPGKVLIDDLPRRCEHGGFVEDDIHVPLILCGGSIPAERRGAIVQSPVDTKQIAVTAVKALGLDPGLLEGAKIEKTQSLP